MTESAIDQYREPVLMNQINQIAAKIFGRHGIEFASAKRAGGWTNATWLAGGLALRIATQQGMEKIRRETELARLFPPQVGYPPMIESGITEGFEWCLSKEITRVNLGEAWQQLTGEEKTLALCQLWQKAVAVHAVEPVAAAKLARTQPWFNTSDAVVAESALLQLTQQGLFGTAQAEVLRGILERFWQAWQDADCVLNHGDLTLDNVLWHNDTVVCLLDFEYAVMAPLELDLNSLMIMAFSPEDDPSSFSEPDRREKLAMQQAVINLALPLLAHPGGVELLCGYALMKELWHLVDWLAHPEGEGPLEHWVPYRILLSLAEGKGGHLSPLLTQAAASSG